MIFLKKTYLIDCTFFGVRTITLSDYFLSNNSFFVLNQHDMGEWTVQIFLSRVYSPLLMLCITEIPFPYIESTYLQSVVAE